MQELNEMCNEEINKVAIIYKQNFDDKLKLKMASTVIINCLAVNKDILTELLNCN